MSVNDHSYFTHGQMIRLFAVLYLNVLAQTIQLVIRFEIQIFLDILGILSFVRRIYRQPFRHFLQFILLIGKKNTEKNNHS